MWRDMSDCDGKTVHLHKDDDYKDLYGGKLRRYLISGMTWILDLLTEHLVWISISTIINSTTGQQRLPSNTPPVAVCSSDRVLKKEKEFVLLMCVYYWCVCTTDVCVLLMCVYYWCNKILLSPQMGGLGFPPLLECRGENTIQDCYCIAHCNGTICISL
jgi:hypothetical protein